MKMLLQIIAIVIFGYIAEYFLPWYSIAIIAFVFGFLLRSNANFLAGLIAIALLWGFEMWMIDSIASTDLASRVSMILPIKQKWILITVTLFMGGLVGGFASLTGSLLRTKRKKSYY